jgi:lipopolysaccharide transport system permease protein
VGADQRLQKGCTAALKADDEDGSVGGHLPHSTAAPLRHIVAQMATAGFVLEGEATPLRTLFGELWQSRGLLAMLARKDFFVRYRRASFGLLWAVALPLLQAIVLAIVFSRVAKIQVNGVNYTVFIFAGMISWTFFSGVFGSGSTSIVDGAAITTKIYFPRAILPLVTVASNLYGFSITALILIAMCLVTGVSIGFNVLLLVPAVIVMTALTTAFVLVFSALHVYFRDIRFMVQAMLIAWFYVTPIIYPLSKVGTLATFLRINPVTGVVELFRAATVGADPGWLSALWWTLGWTIGMLIIGVVLHRRFNRVFVDLM